MQKLKCKYCKKYYKKEYVTINESTDKKPTVDSWGEVMPKNIKEIICVDCQEKFVTASYKKGCDQSIHY